MVALMIGGLQRFANLPTDSASDANCAGLAQSAEQGVCKPQVARSIRGNRHQLEMADPSRSTK